VNLPLVAVVQGGASVEREVSVRGAQRVRAALEHAGYDTSVVELDHTAFEALRALGPKFVFVAAHGGHGEGGGLQSLLELLEIPFTGSDSLASRLCMSKALTKQTLVRAGLPTPAFHAFSRRLLTELGAASALDIVERHLGRPLVVKPAHGGSSYGLRVVRDGDELRPAILAALSYDDEVLIERYVEGRELAVTVLGDARDPQALPIVEIVADGGVYDYGAHYEFDSTKLIAADLPEQIRRRVDEVAVSAYTALGCRDVARADIILDSEGEAQILELNTIPGLTETGPTPFAASLAGMSFADLVGAIAERAAHPGDQRPPRVIASQIEE
jgi:D-alanine-D-alanine ligase